MTKWFRFLKSIETEGGSILILILLMVMFATLTKLGFTNAEGQLQFILGALVGLLKGNLAINVDQNMAAGPKEKKQIVQVIKD